MIGDWAARKKRGLLFLRLVADAWRQLVSISEKKAAQKKSISRMDGAGSEVATVRTIAVDGALAGQRGLFATRGLTKGETVLIEKPFVAAQHLWNRAFCYSACSHCLKSLESAQVLASRLSGAEVGSLPLAEKFDSTVSASHCECKSCGERYALACMNMLVHMHARTHVCKIRIAWIYRSCRYCSSECQRSAFMQHHRHLCVGSQLDAEVALHPVTVVQELWKLLHPPPESASITLVLRMLAIIQQRLDVQGSSAMTDGSSAVADSSSASTEEQLDTATRPLSFLRGQTEFETSEASQGVLQLKLLEVLNTCC